MTRGRLRKKSHAKPVAAVVERISPRMPVSAILWNQTLTQPG